MDETHRLLLELQEMDRQIVQAETTLAAFDPQLESLEAPVRQLEQESETANTRLVDLRQSVRKLERNAEEKRERLRRYQERLMMVRNAREEAAAQTELDLVRRAAEADDREAAEVRDQVTRLELRVSELENQLDKARTDVEPQKAELLERRTAAADHVAVLRDKRNTHVMRLEAPVRALYERVRGGRTRMVLAPLTADGACGQCFSIIPIQEQAEIRQGKRLFRCEACGVILYTQD